MDADGTIFDPLDGQSDLRAGRLKFVGDATQRVKEDALRILRYCRFLPRFEKAGVNAEMVNLLRDNSALCADLSGERVADELRLIMVGSEVADVIRLMRERRKLTVPLLESNSTFRLSVLIKILKKCWRN